MVSQQEIQEFATGVVSDEDEIQLAASNPALLPLAVIHRFFSDHIGAQPTRPATPPQFTLGSLRDGRLRVIKPIGIAWHIEAGEYVTEAPDLNEFGFGETLSDAIADLQHAIAELYFTLEEDKHRLGADLRAVHATLTQKVRLADAARRA